jgi:Protein of unknown function (DUF3995)
MMIVLATINFLIFVAIALLHVYWAFGGTKGLNAAVPEMEGNKKLFMPGKFLTLVVAAGLLLFAIISLSAAVVLSSLIQHNYILYGNAIIACIFLLRAIGDFKYAGLFKKVKHTVFAKNDTKYYSPLCILIATIAFVITYKLYSGN